MKALIWKKAFRARGTKFMALRLLALHVHHAPTGRGRERAYKQELSLRCQGPLDGHQHSSGLPLPPQDQPPPDPGAGHPGWGGGGCPSSQSDWRGQPADSCRAAFRGPCASFLQSTSTSKQNTPGGQQLRGGRGVKGLVAGGREPRAALRQRAGSSARVLRQEKAPRDPSHYNRQVHPFN